MSTLDDADESLEGAPLPGLGRRPWDYFHILGDWNDGMYPDRDTSKRCFANVIFAQFERFAVAEDLLRKLDNHLQTQRDYPLQVVVYLDADATTSLLKPIDGTIDPDATRLIVRLERADENYDEYNWPDLYSEQDGWVLEFTFSNIVGYARQPGEPTISTQMAFAYPEEAGWKNDGSASDYRNLRRWIQRVLQVPDSDLANEAETFIGLAGAGLPVLLATEIANYRTSAFGTEQVPQWARARLVQRAARDQR